MNIFERLAQLKAEKNHFVLAPVVKTVGSNPGKVGFKIIVEADGGTESEIALSLAAQIQAVQNGIHFAQL